METEDEFQIGQSEFSDYIILKDEKAETSFFDAISGTIEEWRELKACYTGALMEMKTRLEYS